MIRVPDGIVRQSPVSDGTRITWLAIVAMCRGAESASISVAAIGRRRGITKASAAKHVRHLVEAGWLERVREPGMTSVLKPRPDAVGGA